MQINNKWTLSTPIFLPSPPAADSLLQLFNQRLNSINVSTHDHCAHHPAGLCFNFLLWPEGSFYCGSKARCWFILSFNKSLNLLLYCCSSHVTKHNFHLHFAVCCLIGLNSNKKGSFGCSWGLFRLKPAFTMSSECWICLVEDLEHALGNAKVHKSCRQW